MLVGLMSDTHDNLPLIDKAIAKMNEANVALVLHAGDYIAGFVIPRFKQLKSRMIGVFGNNDGDHELLKKGSVKTQTSKFAAASRKSLQKELESPCCTAVTTNFSSRSSREKTTIS